MELVRPRWIRDLLRFLPLRSQFVLSGNVRDQYPVQAGPGRLVPLPLVPTLATELREAGIVHFLVFDPAQGFRVPRIAGLDGLKEQQFFSPVPESDLERVWTRTGFDRAFL